MLRAAAAFFLMAFVALPVFSAHAAEKPPKALVEELSKKAHDAFISVKNPEGQPIVKPEDAKKLKYPLTGYDEREMAVARGYLSGYAKWCGLKWQKDFFAPYVVALKKEHGKKWTPFQYAYTEMLHGLSMAVAEGTKKGQTCTAAEKTRLSALAKK
ncbi:MAG TPA: hypothetical protein VFS88_09380 [Micavibrio sp.]|nr:hypothetical protein [Micavibrio sp.]